jgi:hypothetical protein
MTIMCYDPVLSGIAHTPNRGYKMIALQVRTDEDKWFTLAARNAGTSREAELLARVEMVTLLNQWINSGYFPNGDFRIKRV